MPEEQKLVPSVQDAFSLATLHKHPNLLQFCHLLLVDKTTQRMNFFKGFSF